MQCPKCFFVNPENALDCANCGIIFEKYEKFLEKKREAERLAGQKAEEEKTTGEAEETEFHEEAPPEEEQLPNENHDQESPPAEKQCPLCMETIHKDAVKCKHCGEAFGQKPQMSEKEKEKAHQGFAIMAVIVLAVAYGAYSWISGKIEGDASPTTTQKEEKTATEPLFMDIDAAVRYDGQQFTILNNDDFDWHDVQLIINEDGWARGYSTRPGKIFKSNNAYTIGVMQFAKPDGERFNPFQMKLNKLSIRVQDPAGKRGSAHLRLQ